MTRKLKVVSLFSGAMGLDLGLESTGDFEIIACVEKEAAFCETIRHNQALGRLPSSLRVFRRDISAFSAEDLLEELDLAPGEVDVLVGGPPCQSFSTAGRRGTVQDPRGELLWDYLRFIDVLQPKFFIMENVRGLLSAAVRHRKIAQRADSPLAPDEEPGSVVRLFAQDLRSLPTPYHMDCFEVNAVNYGAPQLRERAIFIGNRFGVSVDFPNPTHGPDALGERGLFEDRERLQPWTTLGDAIGHLTHQAGEVIMDFSDRKKSFLSKVPQGSNWRSLTVEDQKLSMGKAWHAKGGRSGWWRRLSYDLPSPTLVTMPNHASTSLCHPTQVRSLSLKEYAAIQEFPRDWEFIGTPAQQYAQVGNAVPVRLGKIAGEVVAQAFSVLSQRDWKPFPFPPEYRVVYVQSHVRTRQWFKGGKTFVWNDGEDNGAAAYEPPQTIRKVSRLVA